MMVFFLIRNSHVAFEFVSLQSIDIEALECKVGAALIPCHLFFPHEKTLGVLPLPECNLSCEETCPMITELKDVAQAKCHFQSNW
jgi:hypothetical protein